MKQRSHRSVTRNTVPAGAEFNAVRANAVQSLASATLPATVSIAQRRLARVANSPAGNSLTQLQTSKDTRQRQLMQLMYREEMTLAQQAIARNGDVRTDLPGHSDTSTHVSAENRKEKEEEKRHQASMSNAWKVADSKSATK